MHVLVTGHNGYIGTVLVPMLIANGHEVTGLDIDLYEQCTFFGSIPYVKNIKKDIRDIQKKDIEGFEAVIHLAGLSNDPLGDYKPELTRDINELGSVRLARLAKEAGVKRFLFASSCSNYGAGGSDFLDENAPLNPLTPYGISKVRAEAALSRLANTDFSPTYLRASTAYGVSPRLRFDLVVNNLTAWAFTTGRVYLKSNGKAWRPVVHIEDISRAYLAILDADRELIHNKSFNIGTTTENYQVWELAEIVKEVVYGSEIIYAPNAEQDKRCYRVNCNRIANTLHDFKPQWTARLGIIELYEKYKKEGLTLEEFEGPKYKRIAHIKYLIANGYLDENLKRIKKAKIIGEFV